MKRIDRLPALAALLALVAVVATACVPNAEVEPPPAASDPPTAATPPVVIALTGEPLPDPVLPAEFRATQEEHLAAAIEKLEASPDDPEAWIWVGRRHAYLGEYAQAIDVYTRALERFPDDPRLYRHRGHRHLTTRNLDAAIDDLAQAARLVAGRPDEIEPDGLPNARGIPTSTLQSNIWYHLGLAHYLEGDFESALAAYRPCLEVSKNADMLTATSYWLYLTLRRLGQDGEAAAVLETIGPDLEIIENHDYHRILLSYRRLVDAHELYENAAADPSKVSYPTVAYGLGAYHLIEGRPDRARTFFERALESSAWAAFGFLAAEAELARDESPTS